MEDITFKTLKNNKLVTIDFNTLFSNKRILVSSTLFFNNNDKIFTHYLEYLAELKKKYSPQNIDDVYVINSTDNTMILSNIDTFYTQLVGLLDYEKKFVEYLKKNVKKTKHIEYSEIRWSYHVLINNGIIENFYETSLEDFRGYKEYNSLLKYIKKNAKKLKLKKIKFCDDIKKNRLISGINLLISSLENNIDNSTDIANIKKITFLYNSLWPNTKLEEYLQIKK